LDYDSESTKDSTYCRQTKQRDAQTARLQTQSLSSSAEVISDENDRPTFFSKTKTFHATTIVFKY